MSQMEIDRVLATIRSFSKQGGIGGPEANGVNGIANAVRRTSSMFMDIPPVEVAASLAPVS